MGDIQHYLRFRVGQEWYGIDVRSVVEVLHLIALTELPDAPPDVLGMMRLREAIAPVIDLRLRFGLANAAYHLSTPIIAAQTPSGLLGLVVDDVDDLERIDSSQITAQESHTSRYVTGFARTSSALLLILDISLFRAENAFS